MFGKEKIQALETQVRELNRKVDQLEKEKGDLTRQLTSARQKAAELESQLENRDLDQLKEEVLTSKAEFEGLKDLYARKIQAFDEAKEEKEQAFAREAALERHNLENEIRDHRQANQEYVRNTVQTFSESYHYYLNQIKLMMDALGDVASRTGEALFAEPNDDLKAKFGQQLAFKLKSDAEALRHDTGDLVLIGNAEEEKTLAEQPEEEAPEANEGDEGLSVEA